MVIRSIAAPSTHVAFVALSFLVVACGGSEKPPEAPKYDLAEDEEHEDGLEMMQEFGGMNEDKVNKVIKRLMPSFESCLARGSEKNELFGGELALLVKVDRTGKAVAAHAEKSTLGDAEVEGCILGKVRDASWPKPVGGHIGLVHYGPIAVEPGGRPPVAWDAEDVSAALEKGRSELRSCGGSGPFQVTAYVGTNGSVISAGVAHADDNGDGAAACLVSTVSGMKFSSPGSWPAKVTFQP